MRGAKVREAARPARAAAVADAVASFAVAVRVEGLVERVPVTAGGNGHGSGVAGLLMLLLVIVQLLRLLLLLMLCLFLVGGHRWNGRVRNGTRGAYNEAKEGSPKYEWEPREKSSLLA